MNYLDRKVLKINERLGVNNIDEGMKKLEESENNDITQEFINEAHTEARQMGYSSLNEAIVDMREKISKQKKRGKTRAEELAEKYSTEVLEIALKMKETIDKETISNKIDLSKIPIDVLDMAIEKKKMENIKESINESKSKMVDDQGNLSDEDYIINNWDLLEPNSRELCKAIGINPNKTEEIKNVNN